jgi:AbrB family looped-hinge helix DNA binding protein
LPHVRLPRIHIAIIRKKGQVTLPIAIRRRLSLSEGDALAIIVRRRQTLELIPIELVAPNRLWAVYPTAQMRIDTGESDLELDRTTVVQGPRMVKKGLDELRRLSESQPEPGPDAW